MSQYIPALFVAILWALSCWYCHRWGRGDGYAEGYEVGRSKGLIEGSGAASPSAVGGPGPVPR